MAERHNRMKELFETIIERQPNGTFRRFCTLMQDVDEFVSGNESVSVSGQPLNASGKQALVRIMEVNGGHYVATEHPPFSSPHTPGGNYGKGKCATTHVAHNHGKPAHIPSSFHSGSF